MVRLAIKIAGHIWWGAWIVVGIAGAGIYYAAFRLRDWWRGK